jgi:hypothetical protein
MMTMTKNHCRALVSIKSGNEEAETYEDDFAAQKGCVERGDFARLLAVISWKAIEEKYTDCPQEYSNRNHDCCDLGSRCD